MNVHIYTRFITKIYVGSVSNTAEKSFFILGIRVCLQAVGHFYFISFAFSEFLSNEMLAGRQRYGPKWDGFRFFGLDLRLEMKIF
jgi:hypothetical protein